MCRADHQQIIFCLTSQSNTSSCDGDEVHLGHSRQHLCGIKSKQQNAASIVGQAKPANPQLSASWVATAETA